MPFDRLTQVLDRHVFEYLLELEIHRAVRYLYFFTLLVIQPDGNGAEGHKDQDGSITETIAKLIRGGIRGTDVVGRIGEDRFFVILHHADFQQASGIGERIRLKIRNYPFVIKGQKIRRIISIGGVCFPTHANDMDGLVEKAEEMLNKSKRETGNRIYFPD